jgi:hypothetical protein
VSKSKRFKAPLATKTGPLDEGGKGVESRGKSFPILPPQRESVIPPPKKSSSSR